MKPLSWDALTSAKADAAFADEAWLTFYLCGDPHCHGALKPELIKLGARNLDGAEGGFVYAKVPVRLDPVDIEQKVKQIRHLSARHGLEIEIIDLDSSDDMQKSKFYLLWNAGGLDEFARG